MTARVVKGLAALVWVSVFALVATGCSASTDMGATGNEPGAGTVVSDAPLATLDPAVRDAASWSRVMTYRSRSGIDDDNTHVTGSVFVPKGDPPAGGFQLVALAPQVIGTAPDCAASRSPDLLGNSAAVVALLQAGYVVFVPDYQGLGNTSDEQATYHPYLDSTTAGYVVIDGIRAAKELARVPTSDSWGALGSFEGGQAVWAANELVDNYGSGLDLMATASLSPVADFEGLADAAMAGTLTPEQKLAYVAFLASLQNEHEYDVDLDDYRRGAALQNWDVLLSCKGTEPLTLAGQIPAGDLRPSGEEALTSLRGYLQKTTLPQGPTAAPMYVIHGGRDPVIPAAWTDDALTKACRMGDVIQIAYWPDQGHQQIEPVAALGWLSDRMRGAPSANDCAAFLAARGQPAETPPVQNARGSTDTTGTGDAFRPIPSSARDNGAVSLTAGWIPVTVQLLTAAAVVFAIGRRRTRSWRLHWIPAAVMVGSATAAAARLFVKSQGWTERAASWQTVFWTATIGFAVTIAVAGWRGSAWWRRLASVVSVVMCVLSAGFALNTATGYFPTVQALWRQAAGIAPEDWIDEQTLAQMVRDGARPTQGTMVWVDIPSDASGFDHRQELVYLPPAWFTPDRPQLPAVVVLGGEFSQPSDWPVSADAVRTLDAFAQVHRGNTPVFVFPDTTGNFSNDTECVNGPRGNAADHLIKDVVPDMVSRFGVSPDPEHWGLVGWSSGGTCALMTAVMHPELFSAFIDLDGQLGPNTGTKPQTVARLFGGDEAAWERFDPRSVIEKHGSFDGMAAWLGVSEEIPTEYRPAGDSPPSASELGDWDPYSEEHADNARKLCRLLSGHGVECAVVGYGGQHDFGSAGEAFAVALPWLASALGTPEVPHRALPGS